MTILSEKSGLIEWVHGSQPTLKKLDFVRSQQGLPECASLCKSIKPDIDRMQALLEAGQKEAAVKMYMGCVVPLCPPLLRNWLLNDFGEPRLWLQARTLFTETTALWSMMGYIS